MKINEIPLENFEIGRGHDLIEAAVLALRFLTNMTTADFELGKDKPARIALREALLSIGLTEADIEAELIE